MDNMDDKLAAVLGNPELMQQIMGMAQAFGQSESGSGPGGISVDQQNLLQALSPYLPNDRIQKLEKAMRAAKMARLATGFLNAGGLQLLTGR